VGGCAPHGVLGLNIKFYSHALTSDFFYFIPPWCIVPDFFSEQQSIHLSRFVHYTQNYTKKVFPRFFPSWGRLPIVASEGKVRQLPEGVVLRQMVWPARGFFVCSARRIMALV